MKAAVIDRITPEGGVILPPLNRNVKTCRGFYHEVTGAYLCPTDYDWVDPGYVFVPFALHCGSDDVNSHQGEVSTAFRPTSYVRTAMAQILVSRQPNGP